MPSSKESVKIRGKAEGIINPEDEALAYLAKILIEAYFEQKNYAPAKRPTK